MSSHGFKAASKIRSASSVTVLVTDDDPTSRLLISTALADHVGEVVEAENGLAGLTQLAARTFNLAIVDLDMPVMDGFGFIERARARPETRHLPIIVVTGRDDVVAIERAYSLGATSFLCKPLNWSIFRYQVAYVLQVARAENDRQAAARQSELRATFHHRGMTALQRATEGFVTEFRKLKAEIKTGAPNDALASLASAEHRLSKLLGRIKRAASVLNSPPQFDGKAVKATDLVTAALDLVRKDLGDNASDRVAVQVDANPDVVCERDLVVEALAQIIENAVLFSPANMPVSVSVLETPPNRVRFEVADRGKGIPEDILERDLEALRNALPLINENGGLGLGLLLSKDIVERHSGHLGIMSEIGRGTEVFLSFPSRSFPIRDATDEIAMATERR